MRCCSEQSFSGPTGSTPASEKFPLDLDPREGPPKGAPSKGLVKSRGNRSRKSPGRPSPSSNFAHRAPIFSKIDPRSIESRCSPDLPKRKPKNFQARAAKLRSAVALPANICDFHFQHADRAERVGNVPFWKIKFAPESRFAITVF